MFWFFLVFVLIVVLDLSPLFLHRNQGRRNKKELLLYSLLAGITAAAGLLYYLVFQSL